MVGARQVLPGPGSEPPRAGRPDRRRGGDLSAGVPTIWNGVLELDPPPDLSSLRELKAGGAAVPESMIRGFEERFGVPDGAGLGNDRDEPAGGHLAGARRGSTRRATRDTPCAPARAGSCRWSISASTPTRGRAPGPRGRGSRAPITGSRRETRSSPTTAGCGPATSPRSSDGSFIKPRRSDQGPGQVRRGMDLVGRARERRGGPPGRDRGRRDRDARRALGRTAVRLRGTPRRLRAWSRTTFAHTSRAGSQSGGSRTASSSSTRFRRPRWASSTRSSFARGWPRTQRSDACSITLPTARPTEGRD